MAHNLFSNRPDFGRTFYSAMWVLGGVAAMQLFAAVWAILVQPYPERGVAFRGGEAAAGLSEPSLSRALLAAPGADVSDIGFGPEGAVDSSPASAEGGGGGGSGSGGAEFDDPPSPGLSRDVAAANRQAELARDSAHAEGAGRPDRAEFLPDSNRGTSAPIDGERKPGTGEEGFFGPAEAGDDSLALALARAALTAEVIEDPILDRLVSTGEELRGLGNMQRALQSLRQAESALPAHPRILAELAATFAEMGLEERARGYWEQILNLGPPTAGAYYPIAEAQIKGEPLPGGAMVREELEDGNILKIGEVKVEEEEPGEAGQRVKLAIVVDADPARKPDVDEFAMVVYFFDIVDGSRIEASTADTAEEYPTDPYDWQEDGTEKINVTYFQPKFSEEEERELGARRYYGYVIELYYEEQLQDKVVVPAEIEALMQVPEDGGVPKPAGPENALFPEIPAFP